MRHELTSRLHDSSVYVHDRIVHDSSGLRMLTALSTAIYLKATPPLQYSICIGRIAEADPDWRP